MRSTDAMRLCFLVGIFLLGFTGLSIAKSANELNAKGYRLYRQGKYVAALEVFEEAIKLNPKHALAHYNSACTRSILRKKEICGEFSDRETILDRLEKSVALDSRRRERMKKDPDLDSVRRAFRYQILSGLSLPKDLKTILANLDWYGPSPGMYGPESGAVFRANGSVSFWVLVFNDDEGLNRKKFFPGRFTVEKGAVIIHFEKPFNGKSKIKGKLNKDGTLTFDGISMPFTDDDGACGA